MLDLIGGVTEFLNTTQSLSARTLSGYRKQGISSKWEQLLLMAPKYIIIRETHLSFANLRGTFEQLAVSTVEKHGRPTKSHLEAS